MKKPFFASVFAAFGYAFKGIGGLLKSETNFQIECVVAVTVIVLGIVLHISTTEWLFQLLAIGLVLSCEALNSAVEKLADALHPKWDKKIGKVKDFAAAAVLLASIIAVIMGLVIYLPYIF